MPKFNATRLIKIRHLKAGDFVVISGETWKVLANVMFTDVEIEKVN